MFHLKPTLNTTQEPLHIQNNETNGDIEFLQPHPIVAADALLEISTATAVAALSLAEHLLQTDISGVQQHSSLYEISSTYNSQNEESQNFCLLGYVYCCRWIPTFQRTTLPLSSGSSTLRVETVPQNVSNHLQDYMASHPRRQ
jgi:hypothetical protein